MTGESSERPAVVGPAADFHGAEMGEAKAAIAGVGMTKFGKFMDRGLKSLASEAVGDALKDAGVTPADIDIAFVGNAVAGLITGQECIRGQVVLREADIGGIPIFNVENACASASSAFHLAYTYVASGQSEVALALGVEKLSDPDKAKSLMAFNAAVDVEFVNQIKQAMQASNKPESKGSDGEKKEGGGKRSMFMDIYAAAIRAHMGAYGTTPEQMAWVASKNHHHGALNPRAQYREEVTVEEVLASREVAFPLTLMMCSPIGDGAAAAVIMSPERAAQLERPAPKILASVIRSGSLPSAGTPSAERRAAKAGYEMAGLGPEDIDIAEVHDATAPAEILAYEDLGFCAEGDGGKLCDEKATALGGRIPVNTSGGLVSKGHPVGASGIAQICEVTWQLRGEAGDRQAEGVKIGLTQNGGGFMMNDAAAQAIHILAV